MTVCVSSFFFFQAEDGIRDLTVTGVQTCALPILASHCVTSFLAARDYVAVASRRALWWYQRAMAWWRRRRADQRSANARRVRVIRSEERRVGKEGRSRWSPDH